MKSNRLFRRVALAALAVTAGGLVNASTASAAIIGFDFEELPVDNVGTPALVSTKSGLTLTLSRNTGALIRVANLSSFGAPEAFGLRTIDPSADITTPTAYLIGNLSTAASSVSVQFGDFGGDNDTVTLTGFSGLNGTGSQVATSTVNYGTTTLPATGIILNAASNIKSFTLSSAGTPSFPNSMYYDNITVTASVVPEPATLAAATLATGGLALRRRRRP